jgi:hypothetical protein
LTLKYHNGLTLKVDAKGSVTCDVWGNSLFFNEQLR